MRNRLWGNEKGKIFFEKEKKIYIKKFIFSRMMNFCFLNPRSKLPLCPPSFSIWALGVFRVVPEKKKYFGKREICIKKIARQRKSILLKWSFKKFCQEKGKKCFEKEKITIFLGLIWAFENPPPQKKPTLPPTFTSASPFIFSLSAGRISRCTRDCWI